MKCSFLDYAQLLMISRVIRVMQVDRNAKKGLLCHWKMKCSFLDYIQLLMIGWVIQATIVDWNAKKAPKSSKNEMLNFGLRSTSDDWPSNLSDESLPKYKKGPLSHQKMKFSFLDYIQLLMIGWVIQVMKVDQNAKKKAPPSHQKMKCSFLDYVQPLMIGQVI